MIKIWAFVYRLTGWYCPFAKLAEYKHIKNNVNAIERRYVEMGDISLGGVVGLEIALWQCDHGFYRRRKF